MISRAPRVIGRLREIVAEVDYAQRRLLEIQTGIPLTRATERALARAQIARLEALYASPGPDPEPGHDADAGRRPAPTSEPRRASERRASEPDSCGPLTSPPDGRRWRGSAR